MHPRWIRYIELQKGGWAELNVYPPLSVSFFAQGATPTIAIISTFLSSFVFKLISLVSQKYAYVMRASKK